MDDLLHNLYYIQHNYDGVDNLFKKARLKNKKISKADVKLWLQKQSVYQQNFTKVEKKTFLPIYSEVPNSYQIDLTFLPRFKKQNNNNYVLFTSIGINTRYAYASYATNKRTDTILKLFQEFYEQIPVFHITGDKGSEFINGKFIAFLDAENIEHNFYKSDSSKLGIINRFHRTLKSKINSFMTATNSVKWTSVLESIITNYNNTYNRTSQLIYSIVHSSNIWLSTPRKVRLPSSRVTKLCSSRVTSCGLSITANYLTVRWGQNIAMKYTP